MAKYDTRNIEAWLTPKNRFRREQNVPLQHPIVFVGEHAKPNWLIHVFVHCSALAQVDVV
jgi:hypothetical protein